MPKTETLIIWLLYLYPLGQFGRISRIDNVSFLLNDFAVGLVVISWVISKIYKKQTIYINTIGKLILGFASVAFISLIINFKAFSTGEILISSLYLFRFLAYSGLYFLIINEKFDKNKITGAFINSVLLIAVIGLLQYIFQPDLTFMSKWGWDPHLFRLTAPFFDPAFTGAILVLGLILIVAKNLSQKPSRGEIIKGLVIYLALAFTYSRSSYLMYLLGMLFLVIFKRNIRFFLFILVLGILTFIFLPQQKSYGTNLKREETVSARFINWQQTFLVFKDHPLTGIGFNTLRYARRNYNFGDSQNPLDNNAGAGSDSSLLFVAATTGIFGFLIFSGLVFYLISLSAAGSGNYLSLCLFVSLTGLLIHSLFANSLFYPWIMEWLWILAGLAPVVRNNT